MTEPEMIAHIKGMVSSLEWSPASAGELSRKWRCSIDDVSSAYTRAVSEMASDLEFSHPGTLKAELVAGLRHFARLAATRKRFVATPDGTLEEIPDPDIKGGVMAIQAAATLAGVVRQEQDPEDTPAQLMERVARVLSEKTTPVLAAEKQENEK